MLKFLVMLGCLLAIANVGVFGGLVAPAYSTVAWKSAAIAPTIAVAPVVKAPLITSASSWGGGAGSSWGNAGQWGKQWGGGQWGGNQWGGNQWGGNQWGDARNLGLGLKLG